MIRQPAVAGSFYPADRAELSAQIDSFLTAEHEPQSVKGLIVPHAGYFYSGSVAGEIFAGSVIPEQVVLFGPNHHGAGHDIAVSTADAWATPLGDIPVSTDLRERLLNDVSGLFADERAHQYEHSLEVMLPFLFKRQPELQIVPIALGRLSLEECLQLGSEIAQVLTGWKKQVLLLASSDMNHFLSAEKTEKLDAMAISAMTDFNPRQLYKVVVENHISMCGVLPAIVVMQAAQDLGASECRLVRYAHSGKVNGDNSRVVGYAGLTIQ